MPRGPGISKETRNYIYRAAIRKDALEDRRILAVKIKNELKQLNIRYLPEEETIEKYISEARNTIPRPMDMPWSLGSLSDDMIKDENPFELALLPIIVAAWKESKARGWPFTRRQAKWMARLYHVAFVKHDGSLGQLIELMTWAEEYALMERTCEFLRQDFNSSSLDSALTMTPLERAAAIKVGRLNSDIGLGVSIIKLGTVVAQTAGEEVEERLCINLPALRDVGFSPDNDRAYAYLLRYLSEGPKWDFLTPGDRETIALELRKEFREGFSIMTTFYTKDTKDGSKTSCGPNLILSNELLEKVGYETIKMPVKK